MIQAEILMSVTRRILIALSALLLTGVYLVPIWQIQLQAPQYPEGIGLLIHHNTITGNKPQDLRNINGLNHYIGMKSIEPDMVPALKIIPYAVLFYVIFGLVVAATGSVKLGWIWLALIMTGLLAAFVDFYMWGYDYGHNLDPNAAIVVPGLTYQPPLIGSKQLLNMRATSMPHWGSAFVGVSFVIAVMTLWIKKPKITAS
jgi:copper chaperone NosL